MTDSIAIHTDPIDVVADTALQCRKAIGLLTEDEVAAILQLTSTGTLATWRSQKAGPPFVKLGKRVFYTQSGFTTWINAKIDEQGAAALPENQPAKAA